MQAIVDLVVEAKPDLRLSTLERLAKAHGLEVFELLAPERGANVILRKKR